MGTPDCSTGAVAPEATGGAEGKAAPLGSCENSERLKMQLQHLASLTVKGMMMVLLVT